MTNSAEDLAYSSVAFYIPHQLLALILNGEIQIDINYWDSYPCFILTSSMILMSLAALTIVQLLQDFILLKVLCRGV